ncbi:LOW QUALITY PROTEIN: uncharacterized protein LOC128259778 [Drosophila gunungcola]|uniref:LOW QUALITY PROTEIN: uncharacterized protein LOC128259778 n=1 Tax=Drosophila gunungcola TaxID=103775 RepID=UPI0022E303C6|nr:LOW QUALITY PROTEIN: uncharacterized protein LOC128259778 [Drosophila gunungcola]
MESQGSHDQGRNVILERQERVSIQAQVRELYRHQSVKVPGSAPKQHSSVSSDLEKIQRTRQKVNSLNRKIEHEIENLKRLRKYFLESKETRCKSGSQEMASVKDMTWGQSLEANQAKVRPLVGNRSPVSGPRDAVLTSSKSGSKGSKCQMSSKSESKGSKCRTMAVKCSPAVDPTELSRRASGGCCNCCGNCELNHRTTYQNSYGNNTCNCNCCCNSNMGQQQHFCGCRGFYGHISPNQGMHFGIPYSISPRQTCKRTVTDLNTQEICRNRALSPKNQCQQKESSLRTKSREKKCPDRGRKSDANKKLDVKIKADNTTTDCAPLSQHKKDTIKKEPEQRKPKVKIENMVVSDFVTSKEASVKASPSKICKDEHTDETKARMYHDYLSLYQQENSKSELGGRTAVATNPTYTRMPVKEAVKTETIKPEDTDRVKSNYNSQEDLKVQKSSQDSILCDADQNKVEGHSSTDEQLISIANLCCCNVFKEGNTGQNELESFSHHQMTDQRSPRSYPKTKDCYYYEETSPGPPINYGCREKRGYQSPKGLRTDHDYLKHHGADTRYMNDSRSVAPWNCTYSEKSHDHDRHLHKTKSATKASRSLYPQPSKTLRPLDKDCKVVKQVRRVVSKERIFVQEIPMSVGPLRSRPIQRSESRQSIQSTSYALFAPQNQKNPPVRQVQREARKTQTEILCREERPTQTEGHARCEKALQVCLEQLHYPRQVDLHPHPSLPTPSRVKSPPTHCEDFSKNESVESMVQNQHFENRYKPNDNLHERSGNSKDESLRNYHDEKQRFPRTEEELKRNASYRTGYGNVYEKSDHEALACRQDDLSKPSNRSPTGETKGFDDSPHPIYKQSIPRELQNHGLRQQSLTDSYNQKDSRSVSPNRSYPPNYKSLNSSSSQEPDEFDHNQCSEWQDEYETQQNSLDMRQHDISFNDPNTEYTSFPDQIPSRCVRTSSEFDRYGKERSDSPRRVSPRSCLSSSPRHHSCIEEGEVPVLETICEKRTRTVTFEDECGDLTKEEHVQETCHSLIDWERALKYHMVDQGNETDNTDDNHTCRSSSSAEHTCIESTCDDDFASCDEPDPQVDFKRIPPFDACPCMYQTYVNLAAMCQGRFVQ